jgi:hypothetical protein
MRASRMMPHLLAALGLAGCASKGSTAKPESDAGGGAATLTSAEAGVAPSDAATFATPVFLPLPDGGASEVLRQDVPNMRYARLDGGACLAELGRRAIPFEEVVAARREAPNRSAATAAALAPNKGPKRPLPKRSLPKRHSKEPLNHAAKPRSPPLPSHVLAPVRLAGPLHGIAIHSELPERKRAKATIEIFDCRLVLALDDFAQLLAEHGVTEVLHMSAFRSEGERGCTPKYIGRQHCGGLAVDVGLLKKADGTTLEVLRDFNGKIGTATCAEGAGPSPATPAATELWSIVCEAARRGLFHVVLTPNYNDEHHNHFHCEITPEVTWMFVR